MTNEIGFIQQGVKTVESAVDMLHKQPLAVVLVFALMALGWAIRAMHWLPNRSAPMVILIVGVVANVFVGDPNKVDKTHPHPKAVLAMYGCLLGSFSIVLYMLTAKRIEKFFPQDEPAGANKNNETKDTP